MERAGCFYPGSLSCMGNVGSEVGPFPSCTVKQEQALPGRESVWWAEATLVVMEWPKVKSAGMFVTYGRQNKKKVSLLIPDSAEKT